MSSNVLTYEVVLGMIIFFVLLSLGMEIFWSFLISGSVTYLLLNIDISEIPRVVYHGIDQGVLMAVAYFILAGGLMSEGGLADALVRWINDIVGWVRGGLAAVAIVASLFFGALTGSGLTSVAALGPILTTRMEKYGYDRRYSIAVIAASGFMGHLIPPSIPLMVYGLLTEQSIAALFASTIVPGVLLAMFYIAINFVFVNRWMGERDPSVVDTRSGTWLQRTASDTRIAIPALLFPIIVVGGIYLGVFTPTEAAAVACAYATLIGVFIYKGLRRQNTWKAILDSAATTAMVVILVGSGMFFSRMLLRVGVAEAMAAFVLHISTNTVVILLAVNILLLILGMFMDTLVLLIIVVPLLLPLFDAIGMNLIHAGAMVVLNCGIGMVTPPYAASLFVGARIADVPVHQIAKPALMFVGLGALPVLFLTTYIPQISLWLPVLICGSKIVGTGG
jgi:C4-dicarboxylate transporter DctM subunit